METKVFLAVGGLLYFMMLMYAAVDAENMTFDLQKQAVPEIAANGHPLHVYDTVPKRHYTVQGSLNGEPVDIEAVHFENSPASRYLQAQVRKHFQMTVVSGGSAFTLAPRSHVHVEETPEYNQTNDVILYAMEADADDVFPWVCEFNMNDALKSTSKLCGIHRVR